MYRLCISILLLAGLAVAASPKANEGQVDGSAAFNRLKALVGSWEADTPKGKVHTTYQLVAGGSVLLERDNIPGEDEMVTAYHLDGDRLVLTHYCMAGNQPRMVAQRYDSASGQLEFAFAGASNLKPGAAHMHNASFQLISQDRYNSRWELFENGAPKLSADFQYTRVK